MTAHAGARTDPAASEDPGDAPTAGRLGPLFAAIWLFFLIDPLVAAWSERDGLTRILGIVVVVAFAAIYLRLWWMVRGHLAERGSQPPLAVALGYVVSLLALAGLDVALVGESALTCSVFVGVTLVMVFSTTLAVPLVLTLAVATSVGSSIAGWGSQLGLAFATCAASVAVFGVRTMIARNVDLHRAQRINAHLAVENERTRFARDLHDILGHSLTVITVKAELAQRLFDVDLDRARTELADLERLSRDALADVRRAVAGYRELTLPGELVRARAALASAEIGAELPNSTDEVASELRELFAWTVREGVTNVIRHSQATRCEVLLTADSAEVRDDGDGTCANDTDDGHGLAGLRERAGAVGATVVVRHLDPGFSLSVVGPVS